MKAGEGKSSSSRPVAHTSDDPLHNGAVIMETVNAINELGN